jgi:ATP-dependent RNA helicase DDX51/DBP6
MGKRKRRDVLDVWKKIQEDATKETTDKSQEYTDFDDQDTFPNTTTAPFLSSSLPSSPPPSQLLDEPPSPNLNAKTDPSKPNRKKKAPVLPWMRFPTALDTTITSPADLTTYPSDPDTAILLDCIKGLHPNLKHTLQSAFNIKSLFPVQVAAWEITAGGQSTQHDICISAATGSGKTLAYALPMVQSLSNRRVPALRGLVIVPTRDLAAQVYEVVEPLCRAVGLSVVLACGRESLVQESEALGGSGDGVLKNSNRGVSDVLIATPGRLIAHMQGGTSGFTLSTLSFLVIDETDRLLRQSYQDWLPRVLSSLQSNNNTNTSTSTSIGNDKKKRVVKFVVSATLTRDPAKIDRLDLHCPRSIAPSADDYRYTLPKSLKEYKIVVPDHVKPKALISLLHGHLKDKRVVIFCSSLQASHALAVLLANTACITESKTTVIEFSSKLTPRGRTEALEVFKRQKAALLVASDAMTRGIDVDNIAAVVNYDAPVYVKTYVHRAGRTARAGSAGQVFTLLKKEDLRHFKAMLRKADNSFVGDFKVATDIGTTTNEQVDEAVLKMKEILAREQFKEEYGNGGNDGGGASVSKAKQQHKSTTANPSKKPKSLPLTLKSDQYVFSLV